MVKNTESPRRTILIADDQPGYRRVLAETLSSAGLEVIEAADGHTVVRQARAKRPDLILVNDALHNPDVAGVVHVLRAHDHTASIPIVLLTHNGHAESRAECSADHAASAVDRCISKPFSPLELVETVDRLMTKTSMSNA